jgi:hypothetical protein
METLVFVLATLLVLWLVWFGISAILHVKSGGYETDCRLREISK